MATETKKSTATKLKNVLVDVHVEADLSGMIWKRYNIDPLRRSKELQIACQEFHSFLRDHRSQDMVQLSVIENRQDLCSTCKERWETYEEEGKTYCASCGAEIIQEVKFYKWN